MVRTWMGTSTNKKFFFGGRCNFLDFTCSIYGQLCSSNKQNKWGTVSTLCVRRLSRRSSRCFDGRRVWAIVALSDPVFSIFYPCSEVFLQIFVLFFGPRSSIFLPKKGGGVPQVHWVIIGVRWGKKNHHSLWFPFRCKGDQKTSRGQDCGLRSCQAGGVEQSLVNCWKFMASWEMFQWPEMEVFRWGKSSRMKVGPNHGNFGFSKKRDDDYPWMIAFSDIDYNLHFVQYVYICIEPAGKQTVLVSHCRSC